MLLKRHRLHMYINTYFLDECVEKFDNIIKVFLYFPEP